VKRLPPSLIATTLILCLAAWLSIHALAEAGRFHPDEAFYMTIARNATIKGDWWLLSEPVDKPPLTFYGNALSVSLVAADTDSGGVLMLDALKGEFAGRLLSLWSYLLAVSAAMALARTLFQKPFITYATGLLLAASPLMLAFAPTAFTDMPMLALALLALWLAARNRWTLAGVCYMLSLSAKPQSVFYLPLLGALILLQAWKESRPNNHFLLRHVIARAMRFMLPVLIGVGLILAWDAARMSQGADAFWQLGQARYTPTRITPLAAIPDRLHMWWQSLQWSFGSAPLSALCFGIASIAGCLAVIQMLNQIRTTSHSETSPSLTHWGGGLEGVGVVFLFGWSAGFIGVHLLLTLNLFDRNQLVLLPIIALLVAYGLSRIEYSLLRGGSLFVLIGLMLPTAYQVQTLPIGGDDGTHDGIYRLAQYLNQKPVATVIYDRWLDWQLDYYTGPWTNKRRVYYPTPAELAAGARTLDETDPRYFVAPVDDDIDLQPWLDALRSAGFDVTRDAEIAGFVVYQLLPPNT
jgi:hypothetical protein